MKKGCFIKSVIILTIITAAILYIVNNKFNQFIFNPGKKLIVNQINSELDYVKDSPEKDSLKALIKDYVDNIKSVDKLSNNLFKNFIDSVKVAVRDSTINRREYKSLSRILKRRHL